MRVAEPETADAIDHWWCSAVSPPEDLELVLDFRRSLANDTWHGYSHHDLQTSLRMRKVFYLDHHGLKAVVDFWPDGDELVAEVLSVFIEEGEDPDPWAAL